MTFPPIREELRGIEPYGAPQLSPELAPVQLNVNENVSLGSGYRAYPGYSAAQVRKQFGIGW